MGQKFRNAGDAAASCAAVNAAVNPPLAPRCVPWRCATVCGCWLPADAQSPVSGLQSGCSCEPVIYFHLAVLARSLKRESDDYSPERTRERQRGGTAERRREGGLIPVRRHAYALEERTSDVVFLFLSFFLFFLFFRPTSYSFWVYPTGSFW